MLEARATSCDRPGGGLHRQGPEGPEAGEGGAEDMMGADPSMDIGAEEMPDDQGMEPTDDLDAEPTDEFGAAAPAAGGDEVAGRAKRESIDYSRRLASILAPKKK